MRTYSPLLSIQDQTTEYLSPLKSRLLSNSVDLLQHGVDDLGVRSECVEVISFGVDSRQRLALEEVSKVGLMEGGHGDRLGHFRVGVDAEVVEDCEEIGEKEH